MILSPIPKDPITSTGNATQSFRLFITKLFIVTFSIQESGVTANRPTTNLWVGRRYWDTTLSKPVWIKSTGPTVWVDATGTTV